MDHRGSEGALNLVSLRNSVLSDSSHPSSPTHSPRVQQSQDCRSPLIQSVAEKVELMCYRRISITPNNLRPALNRMNAILTSRPSSANSAIRPAHARKTKSAPNSRPSSAGSPLTSTGLIPNPVQTSFQRLRVGEGTCAAPSNPSPTHGMPSQEPGAPVVMTRSKPLVRSRSEKSSSMDVE